MCIRDRLLAHLDEHAGRRVVRRTNGVAAHLLQDAHLTLDSCAIVNGTQGTLIVVHANALELHVLTVESKAVVDVVVEPTIAIDLSLIHISLPVFA